MSQDVWNRVVHETVQLQLYRYTSIFIVVACVLHSSIFYLNMWHVAWVGHPLTLLNLVSNEAGRSGRKHRYLYVPTAADTC